MFWKKLILEKKNIKRGKEMNEGISVNVDINKYRIIRSKSCILILNIFSDFN